jgi:hypothetical protein
MNQSDIDALWKVLTTVWSELLSFGIILAGFYALWVLISAIIKWGKL